MTAAAPARPGRPIDRDLTARYLEAGKTLIADRGLHRLNVDVLAAEIGAGKAGFYRRWPTVDHFLATIARGLGADPIAYAPMVRDLVEDLTVLLRHQVDGQRGLVAAALLTRLPHSELLREAWMDGPLEQLVREVVRFAHDRGWPDWVKPLADGVWRIYTGLLADRMLATGQPNPQRINIHVEVQRLVDAVTSSTGTAA